jgi:hypothetical protein
MRKSKVHKEMVKINPGWWCISPNKEMYDLYNGILSERLQKEADKNPDPFKIKLNEK